MDVFALRDDLVDTYRRYATSFLRLQDRRVRDRVRAEFDSGRLWPHPRVGLNPAFEFGDSISALVDGGVLHPDNREMFRRTGPGTDGSAGEPLRLWRHQSEAVHAAAADRNYVLTTGTGSGKSLSYMIPIVDHVLRVGSGGGVKALVVYPMNALANSQMGELRKFLGEPDVSSVGYARYTGQETEQQRDRIRRDPPDVLLTNYVMLELILTRYIDRDLVKQLGGLRFLVLDELHSYRGRQGADVALLVRRLREASGSSMLRCVGTSATLSTGGGSFEDRQRGLADVSSRLFGAPVGPDDVIGETLRRVTPERDPNDAGYVSALAAAATRAEPPDTFAAFTRDPLSSWLESTFGVKPEDGRLVRATPLPVDGPDGAAIALGDLTGVAEDVCAAAIRAYLLDGQRVTDRRPGTRRSLSAFTSSSAEATPCTRRRSL